MGRPAASKTPPLPDHRIAVAARRREKMRARLLDATFAVFTREGAALPRIEDVVGAAQVSRGTFYLYFQTLDDALHALVQQQSDEMTRASLPIYEVLQEPWQRFAVGLRLFLQRAGTNPAWASFMARSDPLHKQAMTHYMREDLRLGKERGQFSYADLDVAMVVKMSTLLAGIRTLGQGVPKPGSYMDECIRMALVGLKCTDGLCERSVAFSRHHMEGWHWRGTWRHAPPDEAPRPGR